MDLLEKTDQEIIDIANPIWDNLVRSSNTKDYGSFTKDFSSQMLFGANEVELGKQWANNKLLTNLSDKKKVFGCLRRDLYVTVLFKHPRNSFLFDKLVNSLLFAHCFPNSTSFAPYNICDEKSLVKLP